MIRLQINVPEPNEGGVDLSAAAAAIFDGTGQLGVLYPGQDLWQVTAARGACHYDLRNAHGRTKSYVPAIGHRADKIRVRDIVTVGYYQRNPHRPYIRAVVGYADWDAIAPTPFDYTIWHETRRDPAKNASGKVQVSLVDLFDSSVPSRPGAANKPNLWAILVNGQEFFTVDSSDVFRARFPLIKITIAGVGDFYRWTGYTTNGGFGESKPVGTAQAGTNPAGVRLFPDALCFFSEGALTVIPGVPNSASGSRRLAVFSQDGAGTLLDRVDSSLTGYAQQSLAGASVSGNTLVSFCCDKFVEQSDVSHPNYGLVGNDGKILGFFRDASTQVYADSFALDIRDLLPGYSPVDANDNNMWQALPFPGDRYNLSPPLIGGRFWMPVSAWLTDRRADLPNLPTESPQATGQAQLLDVGVSTSGSHIEHVVHSFGSEAVSVTNSLISARISSLESSFDAAVAALTPISPSTPYFDFADAQAVDDYTVWERYVTGDPPGFNQYSVFYGKGDPPPVPPGEEGLWTTNELGQFHVRAQKNGLLSNALHFKPRDPNGYYWSLNERRCPRPIPLPVTFDARAEGGAASATYARHFGNLHCAVNQGSVYFAPGHELARASLPDGRSWFACLYPEPIAMPGTAIGSSVGDVTTLSHMPDGTGDAYPATLLEAIGKTFYWVHWYYPRVLNVYRTYLVYSPTPGSYVEVPLSQELTGALYSSTEATTELRPVPENVFQLLAIEELNLVLVLRTDRDSNKTLYPVVEARSLSSPSTVLWKYADLIERTALASAVVISGVASWEAGETAWMLGQAGFALPSRPAMKVFQDSGKVVLVVSTECIKKHTATTNIPTRVEYRELVITESGVSVLASKTAAATSSLQSDARAMTYATTLPRPHQINSMAVASDQVLLNVGNDIKAQYRE